MLGTVSGNQSGFAGGLVGLNAGSISQSYDDANVSIGKDSYLGGLTGVNGGIVSESYAIGQVQGSSSKSEIGGLVGVNAQGGAIVQAYSTTAVSGGNHKGGLIGFDHSAKGSNASDYWDTETSNITDVGRGAGHPGNDPGITGLTTAQLQSGLPAGFDPAVWAENPKINSGFPYLIANPPRK
jgi:hypothetical protein